MDNPFDEMRRALEQARAVERAVADQANALAALLEGNLRHVSLYRLKNLKKQLEKFNARTGRWRD